MVWVQSRRYRVEDKYDTRPKAKTIWYKVQSKGHMVQGPKQRPYGTGNVNNFQDSMHCTGYRSQSEHRATGYRTKQREQEPCGTRYK